ncbi:MAG: hypothetical protein J3Q66DRAFT_330396 [Benniella sp.]|nr:MAG: hypothetical protein J3Q66DRAFT_330396 [Benniella sp.]
MQLTNIKHRYRKIRIHPLRKATSHLRKTWKRLNKMTNYLMMTNHLRKVTNHLRHPRKLMNRPRKVFRRSSRLINVSYPSLPTTFGMVPFTTSCLVNCSVSSSAYTWPRIGKSTTRWSTTISPRRERRKPRNYGSPDRLGCQESYGNQGSKIFATN